MLQTNFLCFFFFTVARQNLDPVSLGGLIDLVSNIALGTAKARSADVLGHVFEYFLGEFVLAEGKKGGQFYTPGSVIELLVEMMEPYKGRVFDPCCAFTLLALQIEIFGTRAVLFPLFTGKMSNSACCFL